MSWLSKIVTWSSGAGIDQHPSNRSTSAPATPARPIVRKMTPGQVQQADTGTQKTLQQLLDQSPPRARSTYNLEQPPGMQKEVLDRLSRHIRAIPPMPEIWNEIQDILQHPGTSASDLGHCVARDPVLSARILTVCNSAAYATPGQSDIGNIPLAIARLGLHETTAVIFRTLAPDMTNDNNRQQIRHIWFHTQAIAALSRLLAEPAQIVDRSQASLNGMLHDIGKLVILNIESPQRLAQLGSAIHDGEPSLSAEFAILGYTHIDAGMMLSLHWRLPAHIKQFIAHHHHPDRTDITPVAAPEPAMVNHLAHLILQHSIDHEQTDAIWLPSLRSSDPDATRRAIELLKIPAHSPTFFQQLQQSVDRLKTSFPDLFPPETSLQPSPDCKQR
ncbi:HDOD domain-containing protein [Mariprofundus ferrooxydans]|uniref:HDOD domain-containing protein n=1 Tax=Mariprofundus ferrooxydans TaxID=314344 RepID=UPI00143163F0|nr:HDOD domain-containing protein [Mariprofundus ferrooxydans]